MQKGSLRKIQFSFEKIPRKRMGRTGEIRASKSTQVFDFLQLIESWPDIVGERNAKKTLPLKHKGSTLTVLTEHSSYSDQIKFLEPLIIQKICKKFPCFSRKLKKINFYSNTNFFEEKKAKFKTFPSKKGGPLIHPHSPEYHKAKKQALDEFGEIKDEKVQQILRSLFIQTLLRPTSLEESGSP